MVFSDITGKTATMILSTYVNGSPEEFQKAVATSRKLKATHEEILDVFNNHITPRQKKQLQLQMRTVESCEAEATELLQMLEKTLEPYEKLLERLMTIPGIKRISALKILSELVRTLTALTTYAVFAPGWESVRATMNRPEKIWSRHFQVQSLS